MVPTGFVAVSIFIALFGIAVIVGILWTLIAVIRRRKPPKIVPGAVPWQGTTSNVQNDKGQFQERYVFILLGTTVEPDGSESRFEKSVEFRRRAGISGESVTAGAIFSGRQVTVYGKEDERGWIMATRIVDKETGAVTE